VLLQTLNDDAKKFLEFLEEDLLGCRLAELTSTQF
jgi:hypothetical protein